MLVWIRARFNCDRCGSAIDTELDSAYKPPSNWAMFDVAVDSLLGLMTSVVKGEHLCMECTVQEDENDLLHDN